MIKLEALDTEGTKVYGEFDITGMRPHILKAIVRRMAAEDMTITIKPYMAVVCCVCKKKLGFKPGPSEKISHSYCDACRDGAIKDLHKSIAQGA